jgi:hypothetical protein
VIALAALAGEPGQALVSAQRQEVDRTAASQVI